MFFKICFALRSTCSARAARTMRNLCKPSRHAFATCVFDSPAKPATNKDRNSINKIYLYAYACGNVRACACVCLFIRAHYMHMQYTCRLPLLLLSMCFGLSGETRTVETRSCRKKSGMRCNHAPTRDEVVVCLLLWRCENVVAAELGRGGCLYS